MIRVHFNGVRFHTKVLVPVVLAMVLLVAFTMYLVNDRLAKRTRDEADAALTTANAVFQKSVKAHGKFLQDKLQSIANVPHFRATFQQADAKTIQVLLDQRPVEIPGELVAYKATDGKTIALSRREASLEVTEFETNSAPSVVHALEEHLPNVDIIRVSDQLFEVVSVPVVLPVSGEVLGVLTFCVRFGAAQAHELSELTGCGIVLIANSNVVAASVQRDDLRQQCVNLFGSAAGVPFQKTSEPREITIPEEAFQPRIGKFESLNGDAKLGYVLLYSYAAALKELRATQRSIVMVSLGGILFSTAVVWFLISRLTRPLRLLRDSAEAVGRGDFTHRVNVNSHDECGELADVFNRMTENLQMSRMKLEEIVTRLKSTQAQLVQSEKLSAIGEFVAGVTHELNNPLTSLLGFSELLQQTNVDERQKRFVDRIAGSARRCQKIVQSLLSFARQHAPERKLTNLNDLVEAMLEILAYEMRTSNIEVVKQLDPALPSVLVDPHQMQQVFLNIVNNARQAMEEHQSSGLMRVRTESLGERVRVTLQDNGPGISEENLKKIFDPFFTTKEAGKGTGLGLSLSYGIVQEHRGTIRAESKPGLGASFIIELPVHAAHAASVHEEEAGAAVTPKGEGKRILVIDDEEGILDFVVEVLSADGFEVDTARDGESALQQLRRKQYDLALCDWKMPGMNGQRLYERVQNEDPAAAHRFVFMTGDVINQQTQAFLKQQRRTCLAKPFSVTEFRSALSCLAPAV